MAMRKRTFVQAINEEYYTINLKARQNSQDIFAYETDADQANLQYYARADGSVDAMPADQLKQQLGQK